VNDEDDQEAMPQNVGALQKLCCQELGIKATRAPQGIKLAAFFVTKAAGANDNNNNNNDNKK
jgi:hypothetical protein